VRRRRGGGGGGQDQTGVQVVAAGKRKIRFHSETKEPLCNCCKQKNFNVLHKLL
jgi:hypothetical protein